MMETARPGSSGSPVSKSELCPRLAHASGRATVTTDTYLDTPFWTHAADGGEPGPILPSDFLVPETAW
jgi:hypothetical protein